MRHSFWKGVVAGALGMTMFAAGAAFAGSGVGGFFNLGVTNRVDAPSTLTGRSRGPMLRVNNDATRSGANGIEITTEPGRPPFKVNSSERVRNLNVDEVDGYDVNDISRTALGSFTTNTPPNLNPTFTTVAITAPAAGFVLVNGKMLGQGTSALCPCRVLMRLRDGTSAEESSTSIATVGNGDYATLAATWVFPVTAGERTFSVLAGCQCPTGASISVSNTVASALFVPFGSTGGGSLGASADAAPAKARPFRITG